MTPIPQEPPNLAPEARLYQVLQALKTLKTVHSRGRGYYGLRPPPA